MDVAVSTSDLAEGLLVENTSAEMSPVARQGGRKPDNSLGYEELYSPFVLMWMMHRVQ